MLMVALGGETQYFEKMVAHGFRLVEHRQAMDFSRSDVMTRLWLMAHFIMGGAIVGFPIALLAAPTLTLDGLLAAAFAAGVTFPAFEAD